MYARVLTAHVDADQIERMVGVLEKALAVDARRASGFRGAYGLVDRSTGKGMLITLWESAEDLQRAEAGGELARQLCQVMDCVNGAAVRETYEVAIQP